MKGEEERTRKEAEKEKTVRYKEEKSSSDPLVRLSSTVMMVPRRHSASGTIYGVCTEYCRIEYLYYCIAKIASIAHFIQFSWPAIVDFPSVRRIQTLLWSTRSVYLDETLSI